MKHNVPLKLGASNHTSDELTKSYEENIYNEVSVTKTKELTRISHKHPHFLILDSSTKPINQKPVNKNLN
jgi:hypothetical protein